MSKWVEKPLSGLARYINGFAFKPHHWGKEGLPIVRIEQLNNPEGYYDFCAAPVPSDNIVDDGDLIFSWSATLKVALWQHGKAALNQHLFKVQPNLGVDKDYLYQLLDFHMEALAGGSHGSTMKHIKRSELDKYCVSIPDLPVQKTLSKILRTIDSQIETTQALIAKQERMRAGLMQDLFTRGVDEHGRLRPPSEKAPHLYHQTELGGLPKGWEVSGLKGKVPINGGHLKTGPFGSSLKIEHWVSQGRPVITIGSLGEGILEHGELLYVSEETAMRLEAYQLAPGDVVFSRVADVGRSVVIEAENSGWIMSSNLMRIRLDAAKVRPRFLHLQLAFNAALRTQVRRSINSGGRDVANAAVLNSLKFAWPTPDEQDQIIVAAGKLDAESGFLKDGLQKLRLQKLGLM